MVCPSAGRLRCRGGWEGLTRHVVECLLTVTMATEPQSFKSVHQVLPRWGWFLQAATRNTSSESQGQLLLHRNQDYYPPLPPFLSWRPPSATVAGCLSARSLLRPAGSARRAPPEHLLQREARGITLAQAVWSVSRHSQAISVSCSVSFLVSRCSR